MIFINIMIRYWPQDPGIELNTQVANLFVNTRQKLYGNLLNKTSCDLYIDLLDNNNTRKLFSIVLIELETLILDVIELDITIDNIKLLNYKILYDLIKKILNRFLFKEISSNIDFRSYNSSYIQMLFNEHRLLVEYILIYLIYGSSKINHDIFAFHYSNTPMNHVAILFENFIIQISDLVICILLESLGSLYSIVTFITNYSICNLTYSSIRSIALFRNKLIAQGFIRLYIIQPKTIYSSRYKVWLLSSNGLVTRYIHVFRLDDLFRLSTIQLVVLYLIEIQDLIIPQVEKFIFVIIKLCLFLLINFLGNSIIFFIRSTLMIIKKIKN
uniref:Ycf55 n=1 Tax=Dicranema revolutum TaxID=239144 RepID=A0A4D6WRS5_9FLOR|nr:hypothetical protein [Dicranema revolutum]